MFIIILQEPIKGVLREVGLRQTENKNNNLQTTKQKITTTKKPQKHTKKM